MAKLRRWRLDTYTELLLPEHGQARAMDRIPPPKPEASTAGPTDDVWLDQPRPFAIVVVSTGSTCERHEWWTVETEEEQTRRESADEVAVEGGIFFVKLASNPTPINFCIPK